MVAKKKEPGACGYDWTTLSLGRPGPFRMGAGRKDDELPLLKKILLRNPKN
jgi:hypothetical protein